MGSSSLPLEQLLPASDGGSIRRGERAECATTLGHCTGDVVPSVQLATCSASTTFSSWCALDADEQSAGHRRPPFCARSSAGDAVIARHHRRCGPSPHARWAERPTSDSSSWPDALALEPLAQVAAAAAAPITSSVVARAPYRHQDALEHQRQRPVDAAVRTTCPNVCAPHCNRWRTLAVGSISPPLQPLSAADGGSICRDGRAESAIILCHCTGAVVPHAAGNAQCAITSSWCALDLADEQLPDIAVRPICSLVGARQPCCGHTAAVRRRHTLAGQSARQHTVVA